MKRYLVLLLLFALAAMGAPLSTWNSYSVPFPMRGAAIDANGLWVATISGIRAMEASGTLAMYGPEDGLTSPDQSDIVALPDGSLLAISSQGVLARGSLSKGFQVVNRSFEESERRLLPGLALSAWPIAILPFEGRLAFYDLVANRSLLSLSQIGESRLDELPVSALTIRADTLYVATINKLYKRTMHWDSLGQDRTLADPSSWTSVPLSTSDTINGMAFQLDTLRFSSQEGTFSFDSLGRETSACMGLGCRVVVDGKVRTDSDFYDADGSSRVRWIERSRSGKLWFVGSWYAFSDDGSLHDVAQWDGFPLAPVTALADWPGGGVVAWNGQSAIHGNGTQWSGVINANNAGASIDYGRNKEQPLKGLTVAPDQSILYGTWGGGLIRQNTNGELLNWYYNGGEGCLDGWSNGTYTIVNAVVRTPDNAGALFVYSTNSSTYGLGYLGDDGQLLCRSGLGGLGVGAAIEAVAADDGSYWHVFVGWGQDMKPSSSGGVDYYTIKTSTLLSGSLQPSLVQNLSSEVGYPRDMDWDAKTQRLWVVGASYVGHWSAGANSIVMPDYIKGYTGGEMSALAVDVQGGLWIGTLGKGVYRMTTLHKDADSLVAVQYAVRQGLLSNHVYDIAIDKNVGEVWFATDLGLSRMRYASVRDAADFMQSGSRSPYAYPNPFRPGEHAAVTMDYVREDARVMILDAAGNRIRTFFGDALLGGRLTWDGTNDKGRLVAPGVYHWWVVSSQQNAKGKLIVEY